MANEISVERRDGVALLTLNAPERRNALTVSMAEELVAACEALDADREVGAVVVRGEGGFFCAGGDRATLDAAGRDPAGPEVYAGLGAVYRSFARVGELEAPTVAAVRGGAVGAGLNLMLATDLRVVARDAKVISGFIPIGLHPGGGHGALLGRTGAREAAAAMALFGERIDGEGAAPRGPAGGRPRGPGRGGGAPPPPRPHWASPGAPSTTATSRRRPSSWRPAPPPIPSSPAARRPRCEPCSALRRSPGRPRSSWSGRRRCGPCVESTSVPLQSHSALNAGLFAAGRLPTSSPRRPGAPCRHPSRAPFG